MNLLQSQDTLRGLSVGVLRAKSQGKEPPNPDAPLWLVNTVLAEKVAALEKEKLAQGAAKGALPSIAEQINQKAGLMALQGQQQQQTQQQMSQQMTQAPQPAPEGVPQPERQPQPEPPVMTAAEGGLARLPVDSRMFDYREGGIIGFAETDGAVPDPGANLDAIKEQAKQAIANLQRYGTNQQRQDPEGYKQALAAVENAKQAIQQAQTSYQASMSDSGMDKPYIAPQKPFRSSAPVQNQAAKPEAGDMGARDRGLASLAPKPAPPAAPPAAPPRPRVAPAAAAPPAVTPAATPPGASPGLPSVAPSRYEQMQMDALNERIKPITVAQAQAERNEATPELLRTPAGLEQLARLKQQQEQYEEGKKSRPMENWMRGLASAARGGIGGFGDAYLTNSEGNRAADAAQADYQNKVMTAVDAMRRGEATDQQKFLLETVAKGRSAADEDTRNRRSNITSARSTESQRESANLDRVSREKEGDLDRKLRVQLNNTPPAQRATVEENAIRDYMVQLGIPYSQAYEKVKQLGGLLKGELTVDQATDNVQKFLDGNPMHIRQIQKEAKDAGKPVPDAYTIRKQMIDLEMGRSGRPSAQSSSLLSAADKIVGAK